MLSFAAGALLSTAFLNLMPEALEGAFSSRTIFTVFLVGLVVWIVLERLELWHHAHEHGSEKCDASLNTRKIANIQAFGA